jgi:hypothetical protein
LNYFSYFEKFRQFQDQAKRKLQELGSKGNINRVYIWTTERRDRNRLNESYWIQYWHKTQRFQFNSFKRGSELCGIFKIPMHFRPNIIASNNSIFPENNPFRLIQLIFPKNPDEPGKNCCFITLKNRYEARTIGDLKITFPGTMKKPKIAHKKVINVLGRTPSGRIEITFDAIHHYLLEFQSLPSEYRNESTFFQRTAIEQTVAWKLCNLSNFEYLLLLNSLMGRSFRDQSFYPIMPWIVSDFDSDILKLNDPTFFRSFEIPREFSDNCGYYLSRIEPFHSLNSGKEEFQSIKEAFSLNCELVPEFFISSEFLVGSSNPVILPKWADSPIDFIYKHRIALESDYISSHLHQWVSSIGFECPQRNLHSVKEGQLSIWRIAISQNVRSVLFTGKTIWTFSQLDGLFSADIRSKNPQFVPFDLPKRRNLSETIQLCVSSFPVFCCLFEKTPSQVVVYTANREPSIIMSSQKIILIHCDFPILAWVDSDFVLSIVDLPRSQICHTIQIVSIYLNVLYVCFRFHVIICGFRDGLIAIFSLKTRSLIRNVNIGIGKPLKILVTPGWGFIVVCMKERSQLWLSVYTINGEFIRKWKLERKIVCWIAWKNKAGFDYLAYCDRENHLFVIEVYFGDVIRAVYNLEWKVFGLHFSNQKEMIVAACEGEKHGILQADVVLVKERMSVVE